MQYIVVDLDMKFISVSVVLDELKKCDLINSIKSTNHIIRLTFVGIADVVATQRHHWFVETKTPEFWNFWYLRTRLYYIPRPYLIQPLDYSPAKSELLVRC